MKKKYALMCLLVLGIVLLSAGCQKEKQQSIEISYVTLTILSIGNTTVERYLINSTEITTLQLLKNRHNVTLNLGGRAVKCIDAVCAESGYWWPMYVNGKISTLGIKRYRIKSGDKIEFRFAKK